MSKWIYEALNSVQGFIELNKYVEAKKGPVAVVGPSESAKAHLSAALLESLGRKGLFLTYNELQAQRLYSDFKYFFGDGVIHFPHKDVIFYQADAQSSDADRMRLEALGKIAAGEFDVVVASVEALAQKTVSRSDYGAICFEVGKLAQGPDGKELEFKDIAEKLTEYGYERTYMVEGPGMFSIRGGIVDIYSANLTYPIRIEFFGDEIDSVRSFDIEGQRSLDMLKREEVTPAKESMLGKVQQGSIFQYFETTPMVIIDELPRVEQRLENLWLEYEEDYKTMLERGVIEEGFDWHYFTESELKPMLLNRETVLLHGLSAKTNEAKALVNITCKQLGGYNGYYNLLAEDIRSWKNREKRAVILTGSSGRGKRLSETLKDHELLVPYVDEDRNWDELPQIFIAKGALNKGFEYVDADFIVVAGGELGAKEEKKKKKRKKPIDNASRLTSFTDLQIGDFVVHDIHGIGQYIGVHQIEFEGVKKDYLKIKYADAGFVYVPTWQMDVLQRYIGSEGRKPKLNKLGGSEWTRMKSRVKESLQELAEELVKLYAERQKIKGFQYGKDTVWQRQFEEAFPYEETEDQLKCIEEIKEDMESDRPMERLLCGDVGYGKTEVALRAAFKCVMDSRQVAYLCPTTVLANQMYQDFKERMEQFPVRVEMLSRFRTPTQVRKIKKDLENGMIDVVIGTHKLLAKDVRFKNLGMLIVDEEQRFGVKHKERIKELHKDVDVLTLSATPIPRTLHMSLTGIRDISMIEEPPEERYPVQTYVLEYNESMIRDAIMREIARGGQVFYLYNKVRTIDYKAKELREMFPDLRIAVGHGQMSEGALEDTIEAFLNGHYDILVCTTIIESGVNMPNVNTLILENAEMLGLAQLYQIRGRVGRSNRLAYAYLTYKKDKVLNEQAEKRLQAIKEFTEFGSGFKIAMRDLEIRGAGNLLGPEQHGHMDAVGYDTYCKLLDEAVREQKGEQVQSITDEILETKVEFHFNAIISQDYIENEFIRLEMYRKIAAVTTEDDADDMRDELIDRFGDIPMETEYLIQAALMRAKAKLLRIEKIETGSDRTRIYFGAQSKVLESIGDVIDVFKRRILVDAGKDAHIILKNDQKKREEIINDVKTLLNICLKD